jgi:hypothetical protein
MSTTWSDSTEDLLQDWSEKAGCMRWLHARSEKKYRKKYYSYSIPVIILSTLTGAANFAMDSFIAPESKPIASACVGGVNIIAGIISTLQNFLKYSELMEGHRAATVSWAKLGRNIQIEMSLDKEEGRASCMDFLKISRAEYDRLIEQSPVIDDEIIKIFKRKFKSFKVSKPSITNGLDICKIHNREDNRHVEQELLIPSTDDEELVKQVSVESLPPKATKPKKSSASETELEYVAGPIPIP